jgi:hypothetical protein
MSEHSHEERDLDDVAWRLTSERPAPSAAFRANLRQAMFGDLERRGPAARRARRLVLAYVASGLAALALAATGLLSSGPLASPEDSSGAPTASASAATFIHR